ncbi:MAG: glycosyltransferase [Bryobacterales bacterium]|nr:glycosyltransferase [Bryobacteraceae bacterium]MDW8353287.1 glycosyltransferase [Bryobacterales bacterium]
MKIVTNFPRFPAQFRSHSGVCGESRTATTLWQFLRHARWADLLLVNCDVALTLKLALVFFLLPFLRRPILANDIVLRKPQTWKARLSCPVKRWLFSRIEYFSLYQKDLEGYQRYFGIGPDRAWYVPFKANIRYRYAYPVSDDGEYVLCFGYSDRDYDLFFDAVERVGCPAAIPRPDWKSLRVHGARFTRPLEALPANVRLLEDDGSVESMIRMIAGARVVAIPVLPSRIAPSGISACLNSMLMGKCVVITEGPGISDVFEPSQALMVPPGDVAALAAAIETAWRDETLRRHVAEAGRRYAEACGGEPELRQRLIDLAAQLLASPVPQRAHTSARQQI